MRKESLTIVFLVITLCLGRTQTYEVEIEALSKDLITKLKSVPNVKKLSIIDFVNENDRSDRLTAFLLEEFSFSLGGNPGKSFEIIAKNNLKKATPLNLSGVTQVLSGASQVIQQSTTDQALARTARDANIAMNSIPTGKITNGDKYKGIDALIVGKIFLFSDYIRVVVQVIDNQNGNMITNAAKRITKTPEIVELIESSVQQGNGVGASSQSFTKDDVTINLIECRQAGQTVECSFQMINAGKADTDLIVYGRQSSRAIDATTGYEYFLNTIRLADKVNSYEVSKTLVRNSPIRATLSFSNGGTTVESLAKIELHCWAKESGYFDAEFRNIIVH